jgi:hypothetical protein
VTTFAFDPLTRKELALPVRVFSLQPKVLLRFAEFEL